MSNEAAAQAALNDADAIIKSLGLDGEGLADPNAIASQIEGDLDHEEERGDDTGTETTDKADKARADSSTAKGSESDKGSEGGKAAATGEEPAGVLLKDGKHFLPYEKHVEERRARVAAEARTKELEDQLAALKASKGSGTDPAEGNDKAEATTQLDDDLKVVEELEAKAKAYEEEGLTELAANTAMQAQAMRSLMAKVQKFGGYVEKLESRERADQEARASAMREEAAAAVENNPTLRYLDDTYDQDPKSAELFERIKAEDAFLKTLPAYQGKPLADRFAAALKRVELETGPIQVPAQYQTVAQVRAAAEERTRKAGGEFRPHTLSDLPGGGTPPGANDDPFENMDPVQLERLMDDPKKMNEILARAPAF